MWNWSILCLGLPLPAFQQQINKTTLEKQPSRKLSKKKRVQQTIWTMNQTKSLQLTPPSLAKVNKELLLCYWSSWSMFNNPVKANTKYFLCDPIFSVDDLSLPDPLPSPFHTARIGWSSSIPCKCCFFILPAFTVKYYLCMKHAWDEPAQYVTYSQVI